MDITNPHSTAYQLMYNMKKQFPTSYLIRSKERVKRCREVCDVLEKCFWEAVWNEIEKIKI